MKLNKKFYFLLSLPRSGNTLFGSLINNNNKNIVVSAHDIFLDLLYNVYKIKETPPWKYFPEHKPYINIYKNLFNNYFKNYKQDHIILRGPYATPDNLKMIKEFFPNPKFIILKRSVLKCLSSMVKINKPEKIEEFVDNQMHFENGFIGRNLYSIHNAIKSKEKYIELTYDEMCENTDKFFKKLKSYLKINIKYNTKKIKKFNVNGICYNDKSLGLEMHKLKNKINKSNYEITKYLPKHIIEKYKKFDLWQNLKEF